MVEAIAGMNIRKALEMYVGILVSPYMAEDDVGLVRKYSDRPLAEFKVIRALMRGQYAFYSDLRAERYIHNIFYIPNERSRSSSNFLLPEILAILIRERKRTGELGVEGFVAVDRLMQAPELSSFSPDDIFGALQYASDSSLIAAESLANRRIVDSSHCKIRASGFFHMRVFAYRFEYFTNVAMTTWVRGDNRASAILNTIDVYTDGACDRLGQSKRRFKLFTEYLREEVEDHRSISASDPDRLGGANGVLESIDAVESWLIQKEEGGNRGHPRRRSP